MSNDKQEQIWQEIKRRAQEVVRNGEMDLTLKIHDGQVTGGEVKQERIKVG